MSTFSDIPEYIDLEDQSCPLGCESEDQFLFGAKDLLHSLPGTYNVIRCRTCGLIRTNPRPTPETISYYYPDNYGPYKSTEIKDDTRSTPRRCVKTVIKKMIRLNTNRIPSVNPGRMLEIGCASGLFLDRMHSKGWQVEGIEFSEVAAQKARSKGYKVYHGALENAPNPDRRFDLITGWMVLEHLHEPILALKKLHDWSNDSGYLVVSVPNANSCEFSYFQNNWYALHIPNHLYHFTPETIRFVLEKSGWDVVKIYHQRTVSNLLASIGYMLQNRGKMSAMSKRLIGYPEASIIHHSFFYPLALLLSIFEQTGRMTIWAKKRSKSE